MKLMLCGKGGCGKSTLSALLAKEYVKMGKSVLVVDADESNFGLHRQLGMELPKDFTQYFGGKSSILDNLMSSNFDYLFFDEKWKMSDIPSEYISEKGGIKLLSAGKIHEAGEGCACAMGTISQQFNLNLKLEENEIAILDMEAGVEHFGRGIDDTVDAILMVIDPSYESMKLCEKVTNMGKSINKPVFYVLNKINANNEKFIRNTLGNADQIIGVIPSSTEIARAGLKGQELVGEYQSIKKLSQTILKKLK